MQKRIKIKVCGIKYTPNRADLEKLPVDYFGYIFYPGSKRYVGDIPEEGLFESQKSNVAVFVGESIENITELTKKYSFQFVQLHGDESPATCYELKNKGLTIIKAFNLHENFEFSAIEAYEGAIDLLLFDSKSNVPGGSGEKFNWGILENYYGTIPFLLSGGIKPDDVTNINKIGHPAFLGVDVNSGFETGPGFKNFEKLKRFMIELNK